MDGWIVTFVRLGVNRPRLSLLNVVSRTGKVVFSCPRSHLGFWSREEGSAVPTRVRRKSKADYEKGNL